MSGVSYTGRPVTSEPDMYTRQGLLPVYEAPVPDTPANFAGV